MVLVNYLLGCYAFFFGFYSDGHPVFIGSADEQYVFGF